MKDFFFSLTLLRSQEFKGMDIFFFLLHKDFFPLDFGMFIAFVKIRLI